MSSPSYPLFQGVVGGGGGGRRRSSIPVTYAFRTRTTARMTTGGRRTIKDELNAFIERQESYGPPWFPAYLRDSLFAAIVQEQYDLYCEKWQDKRQRKTFDPSSIRPDSYEAKLISLDLRLPSAWNPDDRGDFAELSEDCMEITYIGAGKDDADISAVRANFPFRPQCGLVYYEVEIVSKGLDGHIGIGFGWPSNNLDRLPGWEEHSWGYHGDDGHLFSGPRSSRMYGPKFGTGDIIGCGIDFRDMSAFYTKNGVYLGTAFRDVCGRSIYPFVGFKTPGEKIRVNFGQKDFVFDIAQYYKHERFQTLETIMTKSLKSPNIVEDVVLEYLLHHGYVQSATALQNSSLFSRPHNDEDARCRRDIRLAVQEGDIDTAISLCDANYPGFLEHNKTILLRLRCRGFIEMVKKIDYKRRMMTTSHNSMDIDSDDGQSSSSAPEEGRQHAGMKRRRSSDEEDENAAIKEEMQEYEAVVQYGRELQQLYGDLVDKDPALKAELTATFSVLAYSDLKDHPLPDLFNSAHAEKLAWDLNSAILVYQGKDPTPALERIYQQTVSTVKELVLASNAHAGVIEPERDCLLQDNKDSYRT